MREKISCLANFDFSSGQLGLVNPAEVAQLVCVPAKSQSCRLLTSFSNSPLHSLNPAGQASGKLVSMFV